MTAPCRCWVMSPPIPHYESHCCFQDLVLDDCHLGETPPCGHWHEDVPRPAVEAQLGLFAGLALVTQEAPK